MAKRRAPFRVAAGPTLMSAVLSVFIVVTRWSFFANDPPSALIILIGLNAVVFLTYFVLAVLGYDASPPGVVKAPRLYAWPILALIVLLVFGTLFYFLVFRHGYP